MAQILFLILSLSKAVVISCFVILCESHKVVFKEHPDIAKPEKLQAVIIEDPTYCKLLAKYRELCDSWPDPKGDGIAKYLTILLVIMHYVKTIWKYEREELVFGTVIACLSIVLILLIVSTAKNNLQAYQTFQYDGKCQKEFCIIIFDFYKEADTYCYIENYYNVATKLTNKDFVIYILESRINAIHKLRPKVFDYQRDWLIFAAIHALYIALFM